MRLRSLLIEKYGNLERAELAFDPAPGRINLLLAPNGAGKSVLRRAFHDLLFGIPKQSDMKFRFDYPGMHLRADALSAGGDAFTFGWQRKQGRIFANASADPKAARWLDELLAAVSPRQVEMLFALDTARLRAGGAELAAGDGTLGAAMLSGTGELSSARALRRSLDARRAAIWERGKNSRPLNAAITGLVAADRQRREAVRTPRSLSLLQGALEEARARKAMAAEAAVMAQAKQGRLNRIELTRAPLAALAEATTWLAEHGDAPLLPAGLDEQLAQARHQASLAATRLETAREALADARARADDASRDPPADEAEADLARLAGALGDASTKRRDSAVRRSELDEARAEIAAALRDIGVKLPPEQAGAAIPTLAAVAGAREQITQFVAATTTLGIAADRLRKAEAALAGLAAEIATAAEPVAETLAPLVAEIRKDRDPAGHEAALAAALREVEAAERAAVARLPGWSANPSGLVDLTPATEAAYERSAQADADARDRLLKAREACERQSAECEALEQSLAALRRQPLPDAAAVAAARAERDRGWRLIYARAFGAAPDEKAERDYCDREALPMVFERHLRAADRIADARIDEIGRVEQAALLGAKLDQNKPALDRARAGVAQAEAGLVAARRGWAELCAPLRLPPETTLREVMLLLGAREDAIKAGQAARVARGDRDALAVLHAGWAGRLAACMEVAGGTLAVLLPMADARLAAARAAQQATVERNALRLQAEGERRAAAASVAATRAGLSGWQTEWEATLRLLGRPPHERPEVTQTVLARLAELDRHHRNAAGLQARIDDMQADIAVFAETVASLSARLGMPPGADVFATAESLIARRERARSLASGANEAGLANEAAARRVQEAAAAQREAEALLTAVLAACGAESAEAAEQRLAASRECRRQHAERAKAAARLAEVGGGLPAHVLAAEIAALPQDRFASERLAADEALTAARQQEQDAAVSLSDLERSYGEEAAATGASEAAEHEAGIAVEAGRLLNEYLLLRIASGMLGRAMDRVEQNAGPTGVQRIAAAFEAITDGAWTIRDGENDNGQTLLLAQERGSGDPAKQIDQLSEGTRDQLYLALRLVAIEAHVAAAPPLPFIADDILQTFDDTRAHAAMRALVGLSRHVQVIVLTHHPHLLAVAEGLPVHLATL